MLTRSRVFGVGILLLTVGLMMVCYADLNDNTLYKTTTWANGNVVEEPDDTSSLTGMMVTGVFILGAGLFIIVITGLGKEE